MLKALYLIPDTEKRKQRNKQNTKLDLSNHSGEEGKSTPSQKAILDRCLVVHKFRNETKEQKKKLFTTE